MTEQDKEMLERQVELLRRMSPRLDMLDCENVLTAADRIEELVKERKAMAMRDAGYDVYAALEAKLAKAVGSIKQAIKLWEEEGSGGDRGRKLDNAYDGFELLCNTLAELEGNG